jgi:phage/plasmid-like protein (TIGR03299 family)
MAHMIDNSRGKDAFAYFGLPGWHSLGEALKGNETATEAAVIASMDFEILKAPCLYERSVVGLDGVQNKNVVPAGDNFVLYRSDTGAHLNIVTGRYKIVQPMQIIDWIFRLCKENGYTLETLGVLSGGGRYWALCSTKNGIVLPGQDKVMEYIVLSTSADGSQPTEGRQTSIRVVCHNTLTLSQMGNVLCHRTRHSTEWDGDQTQIALGVGKSWEKFADDAKRLAKQKVSNEQTVKLFLNAYYGLDTDEKIKEFVAKDAERGDQKMQKFMQRMVMCLQSSPGADLLSARGTLWGAVNAVTFDMDHNGVGRTQEARFINSQWGKGNDIKQKMLDAALALAQ